MVEGIKSHSKSVIEALPGCKTNSKVPFASQHFNRVQVTTSTQGDTCTAEYYQEAVNINTIVKNHLQQGVPFQGLDKAIYGQVVGSSDFSDLAQKVEVAKTNFQTLPASLRAQFDNNVMNFATYLNSVSDEDLHSMLSKHGLKQEIEPPAVGEAISPVTPSINETLQESAKDVV